MKKKGFTLVELLAVIAILAILVIVAMPNVLGMFSQAKTNTFVTEVQKYMDTAKTAFVQAALTKPASDITFTNVTAKKNPSDTTAVAVGDATLDMDGSKQYYIIMDRHGNFKRVLVWDVNLCYDKVIASGTLEKKDVTTSDMKNSSDDTSNPDGITAAWDNTNSKWTITENGCKGEAL